MHFRLPLKVRIFVHFVRPDRRVEFEAANNFNFFLAIGNAPRANDSRHGDALGLAEICVG